MNDLLKAGTGQFVPALFGDESASLVDALSARAASRVLRRPTCCRDDRTMVLTFLKKFIGDKGLNASSLSTLLAGQGPILKSALDNRLTGALGFASPTRSWAG